MRRILRARLPPGCAQVADSGAHCSFHTAYRAPGTLIYTHNGLRSAQNSPAERNTVNIPIFRKLLYLRQ